MQSLQQQRQAESSRPPAPILRLESEESIRGQRFHNVQTSQRQVLPRQRPLLVSQESRQMEIERTTVQEIDVEQVGERTEQQIQRVSQIHMSVFHDLSKYEQERASTRMKLDEKERQLLETVKTNEHQKKNMIDLQLKYEKLSSMLQNEQANQREIQHRIYSTKQLCGALKEQASQLADNVSRGEDDRDELRLQERQLLDQHDELVTKFRELDMSQRKKHEELKKRCDEQQIQLREQEHAYTTSLGSVQLKVASLEAKSAEQEESLTVMFGDLQQEQEHCSSLQREKALLKDQLQKVETAKSSQEAKIKQMNEMIQNMENEKCALLEDMDMMTGKLRDAKCQLDQKAYEYSRAEVQYQSAARTLEDNISILTADLHNSCERSCSLENQLNAVHVEMKDLRESLDSVHSQKMEADQFITDLQTKKDVFEVQVHDLSDQLEVINKGREDALTQVNILLAEKSTLESKLVDFEGNMAGAVDKSALLEQELQSQVDLLKQKEVAVSQLKSDLEVALSNQETATMKLNDLRQQQEKDSDEQSRVAKILTETETEKEQLRIEVKGIKEVLIDLKSELEASRIEEIDMRSQLEVALMENEQLKKLTEELSTARQKSEQLVEQEQAQISSFRQSVASANEKASRLNDEVDILTEKLHDSSSYASSLNSKINGLLAVKQQLEVELSSVTKKLEMVKTDCALLTAQLGSKEEEVTALTKKKDIALNDLKTAQQDFELQMNELCRTVEQYKIASKDENQRTVEQKDQEMAELVQLRADQEKEHHELLELRSHIETLTQELRDAQHAKAAALDELSSGRDLVKQLKDQLEDKEKEVEKVYQQLKHLDQRPLTPQHTRDCIVPSTPKPSRPNLRQATTPRNITPSNSSQLEPSKSGSRPRSILKPVSENAPPYTTHGNQSKIVAFAGCASPTSSEATEDGLVSPLSPPLPAKKAKSQPMRDSVAKSRSARRQSPSLTPKCPRTPQISTTCIGVASPSPSAGHSSKMRKEKAGAVEREMSLFKELFPQADEPPYSSVKSPMQRARQTPSSKLNLKKPKINKSLNERNDWNDADSIFRFVDDD